MTFSGRVEARITVPTGGAAVSVATGGQTASAAVTVPAANYYMTTAGGVSSLLTTLQTQLNNNIQGYPTSAALMNAAVGYGTWTAGWLFNITSGNDSGAFGGVTMTAVASPTYQTVGPKAGIDYAVGFDSATDAFSAGDNFDVTAVDDLAVAWVGYVTVAPSGSRDWFGKRFAGPGWYAFRNSSNDLFLFADDGVDSLSCSCNLNSVLGEWHVGIAVIDRSTSKMRIAVRGLTSGTAVLSTETSTTVLGDTSSAVSFTVGAGNLASVDTDLKIAGLYVGAGLGAGTGLSAGISTALTNLASAINASWSVSLSTTTGLVSIGYTTPPAGIPSWSLDWTSTSLRDLLGFPRNINYATTAADLAAQIGQGTYSAAYLFNESSGNAISAFGTPATLTASGTITYSLIGPRGGADKAVLFTPGTLAKFSGGDVFDVTAADDLVMAWVAFHSTTPAATRFFAHKYSAGNPRWFITSTDALVATFAGNNGSTEGSSSVTLPTLQWYVGMAVAERATGQLRIGYCPLGGSPTVGNAGTAPTGTWANAASFQIGEGGILDAIDFAYLSYFAIGVGPNYATGMVANLSTALSNFAATFAQTQTGTAHARGVWRPDCPLNLEGDPKRAPLVSDLRQSVGPTGQVLGLVGNTFKRHRNIVWSHVPLANTWEAEASLDYSSWEWFYKETQLGLGSSWFPVNAPLQIYNHAGVLLGQDDNSGTGTTGWSIVGVRSIEPTKSVDDWTGLWRIEIPQLLATGS